MKLACACTKAALHKLTPVSLVSRCSSPLRTKLLSSAARSILTINNGESSGDMREYSLDGTKITTLVHLAWKQVVTVGDTAIDATCGNGHDTLALAKLVCGDSDKGTVYSFDSQEIALANTSALLDRELTPSQRKRVYLYWMCHSKLGEIIKANNSISVVAFNLGYLPGGDKMLITEPSSTIEALKCATRLVKSGGIITIVSYVGHSGGREEYEAVRKFMAELPAASWVCSQREWLNRPQCPRLLVLFKR